MREGEQSADTKEQLGIPKDAVLASDLRHELFLHYVELHRARSEMSVGRQRSAAIHAVANLTQLLRENRGAGYFNTRDEVGYFTNEAVELIISSNSPNTLAGYSQADTILKQSQLNAIKEILQK